MIVRISNYIGWLLFLIPTSAASASNNIIPPSTLFSYSKEELKKLMEDSVHEGIKLSHDHALLDVEEERQTQEFLKDHPDVNLDSVSFQMKALEIKERINQRRDRRAKQRIQTLFNNYVIPKLEEKKGDQ